MVDPFEVQNVSDLMHGSTKSMCLFTVLHRYSMFGHHFRVRHSKNVFTEVSRPIFLSFESLGRILMRGLITAFRRNTAPCRRSC